MGEEIILTVANKFNQAGGTFDPSLEKRVFAATSGEFNLLQLFRKVFGYRGIPYGIVKSDISQQINSNPTDFDAPKTFAAKQAEFSSVLGTPIFQPVTFKDTGDSKGQKIQQFLLPNEPLVTISGAKKLIETISAGGDNDVIEHISLGHYEIKIQGFCVNMDSDDMPETEIRRLREFYELRRSIEIVSPLLTIFGIELFAFKTITFPAVEGTQAIQGYEISGRSDKYIQLKLADV